MPNPQPSYRPKTIAEIGLKKFLDESSGDHGGNGYDDFVRLVIADAPNSVIGRVFGGADPRTIKNWREVYEQENNS